MDALYPFLILNCLSFLTHISKYYSCIRSKINEWKSKCNYVFVLLCVHLWSNRNHNAHGLQTQRVKATEMTAVNVNGFLSLIRNWKHNLHNTHFFSYLHQITVVTWVSVMNMKTQSLTLVHYILCIICWLSLLWTMKA